MEVRDLHKADRGATVDTCSVAKPQTAPLTSIGEDLHRRIAADRWCVTREDLFDLRQEICRALDDCKILPSARDPFDPKDRSIGPDMYTIVEDYIKPLTNLHGGMSWALMKHPSGLKCDLFVSHAWAEGIFEILDKVIYSWPSKATSAYICAFGNPQNLDISSMISQPKESPFARALASCSSVLVVPNSKVSIYSRLWCVYEAFLAYELGKDIYTATRALSRDMHWSLFELCPTALVCWLLTYHFKLDLGRSLPGLHVWYWHFFCMLVLIANPSWLKRVLNHLGLFLSVHLLMVRAPRCAAELVCNPWIKFQWCWASYLACVLQFAFAQIDLVRCIAYELEAHQLRNGFSGNVSHARCSMARDSLAIGVEISARGDHVNHTINVLLNAGMSDPELQALSREGMNMHQAGYFNIALTWSGWYTWITFSFANIAWGGRFGVADKVSLFCSSCWLCIWMVSSRSRRAFVSSIAGRIMVLVCQVSYDASKLFHFSYKADFVAACGILALLISIVGPLRLLRVPIIGERLLWYLTTTRMCYCASRKPTANLRSQRMIELTSVSHCA